MLIHFHFLDLNLPSDDKRLRLCMWWQLPGTQHLYREKPLEFIAHLLCEQLVVFKHSFVCELIGKSLSSFSSQRQRKYYECPEAKRPGGRLRRLYTCAIGR